MIQYSKLKKLIEKFADGSEKQMKDYLDPNASVAGTFLRVAFRRATVVKPSYKKICAELDLLPVEDLAGYTKNLREIAEFAKLINNFTAVDKLESVIAANKK